MVALKKVLDDDELMIMTKNGVIIRLPIKGVSLQGRNTQGVRLINLEPGDEVIDVARVANEDDENGARERQLAATAAGGMDGAGAEAMNGGEDGGGLPDSGALDESTDSEVDGDVDDSVDPDSEVDDNEEN